MTRALTLSLFLLAAGCAKQAVRAEAPTTAQPAAAEYEPDEEAGCEAHGNAQPHLDSDEGAVKAFENKPEPGAKAICAVSDEPFTVTAETEVAEYNGKWYAFCCDDCVASFQDDPAEYAVE